MRHEKCHRGSESVAASGDLHGRERSSRQGKIEPRAERRNESVSRVIRRQIRRSEELKTRLDADFLTRPADAAVEVELVRSTRSAPKPRAWGRG